MSVFNSARGRKQVEQLLDDSEALKQGRRVMWLRGRYHYTRLKVQ